MPDRTAGGKESLMLIQKNAVIDPLSISFRELKSMLPSTLGKLLPTAENLSCDNENVLCSYDTGMVQLTVFWNGFFLCQEGCSETVYAVDRCRQLSYIDSDGVKRVIREKDYSDGPCLIPLLLTCANRSDWNPDDFDFFWHEFSSAREWLH